jgi:hypothetical protein
MNTFYIQDTTIGKYVHFKTVGELVNYLGNNLVPRAFQLSRKQYTQNLADLGHGPDDAAGVTLTRAVSEQFNIGVVRNGNYVRTDVHTATSFLSEGYGD